MLQQEYSIRSERGMTRIQVGIVHSGSIMSQAHWTVSGVQWSVCVCNLYVHKNLPGLGGAFFALN